MLADHRTDVDVLMVESHDTNAAEELNDDASVDEDSMAEEQDELVIQATQMLARAEEGASLRTMDDDVSDECLSEEYI